MRHKKLPLFLPLHFIFTAWTRLFTFFFSLPLPLALFYTALSPSSPCNIYFYLLSFSVLSDEVVRPTYIERIQSSVRNIDGTRSTINFYKKQFLSLSLSLSLSSCINWQSRTKNKRKERQAFFHSLTSLFLTHIVSYSFECTFFTVSFLFFHSLSLNTL